MFWWLLPFLALSLVAGVCIYCFVRCFYSANKSPVDPYGPLHGAQYQAVKDKIYTWTRNIDSAPFEKVAIQSFDGLTLTGRYYHFRDGAPVKIIFHGYRSFALRDCAGGFAMCKNLGINVLTIDERAHGDSDGHTITFGIRERRDCLAWCNYICDRFGAETPIILSGLSMGAATVLMAASLSLPENVCCILSDSPFSSPKEIIKKVCTDMHISAPVAYPFIWLSALIFGRFNLNECTALDGVRSTKIPILILHGEDDYFVPCEMSEYLHRHSNGMTQLATFPGAGHGLSYMIAPEEYEKVVYDFLAAIPPLSSRVTFPAKTI